MPVHLAHAVDSQRSGQPIGTALIVHVSAAQRVLDNRAQLLRELARMADVAGVISGELHQRESKTVGEPRRAAVQKMLSP